MTKSTTTASPTGQISTRLRIDCNLIATLQFRLQLKKTVFFFSSAFVVVAELKLTLDTEHEMKTRTEQQEEFETFCSTNINKPDNLGALFYSVHLLERSCRKGAGYRKPAPSNIDEQEAHSALCAIIRHFLNAENVRTIGQVGRSGDYLTLIITKNGEDHYFQLAVISHEILAHAVIYSEDWSLLGIQ